MAYRKRSISRRKGKHSIFLLQILLRIFYAKTYFFVNSAPPKGQFFPLRPRFVCKKADTPHSGRKAKKGGREKDFPQECLERREKTRIFACEINISVFPASPNILGENPSPARLFLKKTFRLEWGVRRIRKWSDTTWTHGKNNFHNFYNNEQKSGN